MRFSVIVGSSACLFFLSCKGGDEDSMSKTDSGVAPAASYSGLSAGRDEENGALAVSFPKQAEAKVTGAIRIGSETIMLRGDVDSTMENLAMSGFSQGAIGDLECSAAIEDSALRGACVGSDSETRSFYMRERGAAIGRYCGTFHAANAFGDTRGTFNIISQGATATAVYWSNVLSGIANGSVSGSNVSLTLRPTGAAIGHIDNAIISGTLDAPLFGTGTFTATAANCPGDPS